MHSANVECNDNFVYNYVKNIFPERLDVSNVCDQKCVSLI